MTGDFSHSIFSPHFLNHFSSFTNLSTPVSQHSSWILDTRATDHVVNSTSYFTSFTPVSRTYVNLPNGLKVTVTQIGTVALTSSLNCCVLSFAKYCFVQVMHA